jgi:hypothetical protein
MKHTAAAAAAAGAAAGPYRPELTGQQRRVSAGTCASQRWSCPRSAEVLPLVSTSAVH